MVVAEIAIQMIRGTFDFLYPFIMRENGGSTGWVYLMSIVQRLAFMLGIFASSKQGARGQMLGAIMGLGAVILLTVNVISSPGLVIFTISLAISALASGMIYGYSSHVMLRHKHQGETLRLAALYEAVSGLGYGIIVVISGLGGENDTRPVFIGLMAFLAVAFTMFAMTFLRMNAYHHRAKGKQFAITITAMGTTMQVMQSIVNNLPVDPGFYVIPGMALPVSTAKK
jgi:hypothetical protein